MAIDESKLSRAADGKVELRVVRSIAFGDKVLTFGYEHDPLIPPELGRLLPKNAGIPFYVESGRDFEANDEGVLQLSLSVDQAQQIVDQLSHLLAEYEPPPEDPRSVN